MKSRINLAKLNYMVICTAFLLAGCGGEAAPEPMDETDFTPEPTVFGIDQELQRELRSILADYVDKELPGGADEHLDEFFKAVMNGRRNIAADFEIKPDAEGNYVWPELMADEVAKMRAEFDAKTLFEVREIRVPPWAEPLVKKYHADQLRPTQRELLFQILSGQVIGNLSF